MLTTFKATAKTLPEGLQVETNSRGFKILLFSLLVRLF